MINDQDLKDLPASLPILPPSPTPSPPASPPASASAHKAAPFLDPGVPSPPASPPPERPSLLKRVKASRRGLEKLVSPSSTAPSAANRPDSAATASASEQAAPSQAVTEFVAEDMEPTEFGEPAGDEAMARKLQAQEVQAQAQEVAQVGKDAALAREMQLEGQGSVEVAGGGDGAAQLTAGDPAAKEQAAAAAKAEAERKAAEQAERKAAEQAER